MNRFFRRMERFGKSFSGRRSQGAMANHERELFAGDRRQDTADPRAKNAGHGKKTADTWNQ